jgi:hypothetical protein
MNDPEKQVSADVAGLAAAIERMAADLAIGEEPAGFVLALEGDARVSRLISDVNNAIDLLKAHVAAHRDNAVMCTKAQPSRHQRNPSEPVSSSRKRAGITAKRRNAGVPRGADAGLEPIASDSCGGGQPPLSSWWYPPTYP